MTIEKIAPAGAVTADQPERVGAGPESALERPARRWVEFNIHDCATMRVAEDASSASILRAMKVQVVVGDGGYRLHGTRELLTAALPLLDKVLVGRDVAMIHAATFT